MNPDYQTDCPRCHGALYPLVLDPDTPPWVCVLCRRAWWVAELSEEARKLVRVIQQDFGFGAPAREIEDRVEVERVEAQSRGTSLREDQIQLVHSGGLKWLQAATAQVDKAFIKKITAELKRRKV